MIISSDRPIRVMVVDDHTMVRRGLATFLKVFDDLQLAAEAENAEAALRLCEGVMPDVILMDMVLPEMDGATAIRAIRQKFPQSQVIALTSFKDGKLVRDALEAGAIGFLFKDVSADELAQAIRAAHVGRATLSAEAAQAFVRAAAPPPAPGFDLTERERQVLELRFGMMDGREHTLEEVSRYFEVTRERIRQIESKALRKLRHPSRSRLLKDYLGD